MGSNTTVIGEYAFQMCSGATSIKIPDTVTTIKDYAFFSCASAKDIFDFSDNLTSIGIYAFYNCSGATGTLVIKSNIQELGKYAFFNCNGITELDLENISMTKLEEGLFYNCSGLKGDLTIPDIIEELGEHCFANCYGIDGVITIGSGIETIEKFTFYRCSNVDKIVLDTNVKKVKRFAFANVPDVYYLGSEDELDIDLTANFGKVTYYHFPNCTHKLTIDVPEGYEVINKDTNEVLTTNDYACGTNLNIGLRAKAGYTLDSNLSVVIEKSGKFKNVPNEVEKFDITRFNKYEIKGFKRDYIVSVKDTTITTDFVLRTFISQLNYNNLEDVRTPIFVNQSGAISYNHTKVPVETVKGDILTFKIRVYNEGNQTGNVNEITTFLPEGIILQNSEINRRYGWVEGENGKVSTRYLENKNIQGYSGKGEASYEEIALVCKVVETASDSVEKRLVTISEISECEVRDTDSVFGQITSRVSNDYKSAEAYGSDASSFVRSDDDDTDFENIVMKRTLPVDYKIKITKIDSETNELLKGAVFELRDISGNTVSTATTGDDGVLDFGVITTYGEGTDIYYIEETSTPEGYAITERETIEVNVTKKILDESVGTYSLKVLCQTLNYSTDITRYNFVPVSNREQLEKIGSGETIHYEGFDYVYDEVANYRLVEDIDLAGRDWTPINKKISGIFDGNGHAIKNLTINETDELEISEVGLFRSFSGIVQGLNLENVNINISGMKPEENGFTLDSLSGYTCVGAFAGYMERGTVKACNVSGNINANCSNVGGFIGHSEKENIIKFQACTSSININANKNENIENEVNGYTGYNIGGFIGCSIGALSMDDCVFEGEILGNCSNIGGFAGFVEATDYEVFEIQAGYTEDDKEISLLVKNTKTAGRYDVILENRDLKTLGIIDGAKYTVYDSELRPIEGFRNITLNNGSLRIATVNIRTTGVDTYYIKEEAPAPGYVRLNTFAKVIVSRYWDRETESYRVSVDTNNILQDNIDNEDKRPNYDNTLQSVTGQVAPQVTFENVGWNENKAAFINCINKGDITGFMNISGMLGSVYCNVKMENCQNLGDITATGYGKAAGFIAEIIKKNNDNIAELSNCVNEGDILSVGTKGSAGGVIAQAISNVKLVECINKGEIIAGNASSAAGILADVRSGNVDVYTCSNEGKIKAISQSSVDIESVAGGIIGKNQLSNQDIDTSWGVIPADASRNGNNITILDSYNIGDIESVSDCGGIIGLTTSDEVIIKNSINKENELKGTWSNIGGMVGFASVSNLEVRNCTTNNTKFSQLAGGTAGYEHGYTAGMVGSIGYYSGYGASANNDLTITQCNVYDCSIKTTSHVASGIVGGGYMSVSTAKIKLEDCKVERNQISSVNSTSYYCSATGVSGAMSYVGPVDIKNCDVQDCNFSVYGTGNPTQTHCAGISGSLHETGNVTIKNCNVDHCELYNDVTEDASADMAGILSYTSSHYSVPSSEKLLSIEQCNVRDCNLQAFSGNLGGIFGSTYTYNLPINISKCLIEGTTLYSVATTNGHNCSTGGMVGFVMSPVTCTDCSVIGNESTKAAIYGRGKNVGGILGQSQEYFRGENIVVKDITIDSDGEYFNSSTSTPTDTVGGMVGSCLKTVRIKNGTVENASITGYVGNAAGITGAANYSDYSNYSSYENITIKNVNIENTSGYKESCWSQCANVAGIVATNLGSCSESNHPIFKNCTIENTTISGKGENTAGVAGFAQGCEFDTCILRNTNINKKEGETKTGTVGGLCADFMNSNYLRTVNCLMENVNITSDVHNVGGMFGFVSSGMDEFSNNTINGMTIIDNCESTVGYKESIGGFIGCIVSGDYNRSKIEGCSVTDLTVESKRSSIGGFVGYCSFITIEDSSASNLNLKNTNEIRCSYNGKNIGGFAGVITSDRTIIKNSTVSNSVFTLETGEFDNGNVGAFTGFALGATITGGSATNNTIINKTEKGMAGGIIGAGNCNNRNPNVWPSNNPIVENHNIISVNGTNVIGGTIEAEDMAGGIAGYGVVQASNLDVSGVTIKSKSDTGHGAGGIVGVALAVTDSIIDTVNIKNSTIESADYAGGIAGYTSGTIKNSTVEGTTITSTGNGWTVGGIAGMIYDANSEISGSTVKGSTVRGAFNVGGIAGHSDGKLTNNQVLLNSRISTTLADGAVGGIVGMAPVASTQITSCTLNGSEVTGINGYTGGIAGYATGTLTECTVDTGVVKAMGATAHGLGGILGHGSNETGEQTVITSPTVQNSTLVGGSGVGEICGDGVEADRITSSTVADNTVTDSSTGGTGASLSSDVQEDPVVEENEEKAEVEESEKVEKQEEVSEEPETTEDLDDASDKGEIETTSDKDEEEKTEEKEEKEEVEEETTETEETVEE